MHEMSIAQSLLDIIKQEMEKHNLTKLIKCKVVYGRLSQIVPEALDFAFEVLTKGTEFEDAQLVTEMIPLSLRCSACGEEFAPDTANVAFAPCPKCDEEFGHEVLTGRELYLQDMEAE